MGQLIIVYITYFCTVLIGILLNQRFFKWLNMRIELQ